MIRKANINDYIKLAISINKTSKKSPYINKELLHSDIVNGNCYIYEKNGKAVAIGSLVFDNHYQMYYH